MGLLRNQDILMNPVYRGYRFPEKDYRISKSAPLGKKPEDWIVVEERHEPMIDHKSFDIVQDKLKSGSVPPDREISLFAGLLKMWRVWEITDYPLHKRQTSPADLFLQDL